MKLIKSFIAWVLVIGSFVFHALIAPIVTLFKKGQDKEDGYYWSSVPFVTNSLKIAGVKIKTSGLANLPPKGPIVLIANHQSILDIWICMAAIPLKIGFFAKEELLKVPILGSDIYHQGHFFVDRNNPRKAVKQMKRVKEKIKKGHVVMIFPEGTRSSDFKIASFKRGAFQIALEAGATIVPIYIDGSGRVLPKNRLLITPKPVSIHIGKALKAELNGKGLMLRAKELTQQFEIYMKEMEAGFATK